MTGHPYSPTRYVRVRARFAGEPRPRTVVLEVAHDDGTRLSGYVVNREGCKVEHRVEGEVAHEYVVVRPADVVARTEMRLNLHYGELEEAP